jgi:hypothetical protein
MDSALKNAKIKAFSTERIACYDRFPAELPLLFVRLKSA